jgi:hypothetical protein
MVDEKFEAFTFSPVGADTISEIMGRCALDPFRPLNSQPAGATLLCSIFGVLNIFLEMLLLGSFQRHQLDRQLDAARVAPRTANASSRVAPLSDSFSAVPRVSSNC